MPDITKYSECGADVERIEFNHILRVVTARPCGHEQEAPFDAR